MIKIKKSLDEENNVGNLILVEENAGHNYGESNEENERWKFDFGWRKMRDNNFGALKGRETNERKRNVGSREGFEENT